jgi:hypothetical protein
MKRHLPHSLAALVVLLAGAGAAPVFAAPAQPAGRSVLQPLPAEAVAAIPLSLDPAAAESLAKTGEASLEYGAAVQTRLCPVAEERAGLEAALAGVKPTIGVESLAVVSLPDAFTARPARELAVYNILHSFGSMVGIQYYSQSRGAMHVFFTRSELVKGPSDRSPLPDPSFTAIEPLHRYFLVQEDASFGKNLYAIAIRALPGGGVALDMQNLEQAWYGIVPVLGPRALDMHVLVQPSADGKRLYFYGNCAMATGNTLGLADKVRASYRNRLTALCNWFAARLSLP